LIENAFMLSGKYPMLQGNNIQALLLTRISSLDY